MPSPGIARLLPLVAVALAARPTSASLLHYDFVEIGTSDFDTIMQQAPDTKRGLSIDAMLVYLNRLPIRRNVTKVNAAVVYRSGLRQKSGSGTKARMYYVAPDDIEKYKLPAWLKGCSRMGKPLPEALAELERRDLGSLMQSTEVPLLTFGAIAAAYRVGSIGFLKVDTEGNDVTILQSALSSFCRRPSLWPETLSYEHQHVADRHACSRMNARLRARGYKLLKHSKRDYVFQKGDGFAAADEAAGCDFAPPQQRHGTGESPQRLPKQTADATASRAAEATAAVAAA